MHGFYEGLWQFSSLIQIFLENLVSMSCNLLEDKKFLLDKEFLFKKLFSYNFATFIKLPEDIHWPKYLPPEVHEHLCLSLQRQHI